MKTKNLILLDLFSGIGNFHTGLSDAGFTFKKTYFSEIDRHAICNYRYNFPEAEYIGSVTTIRGATIKRPNIITFGSPCQDFSIAGMRRGLDGKRSSLISEAIRLIDEHRPDVFIWENVKGAFSSNNRADFWAIIQAFTHIGGYRFEWQLLNTSWFLPQNRERIYLVGTLGNQCKRDIFPIGESLENTNQKRQQQTERLLVNCLDANYAKGPDGKRTMIQEASTLSGKDATNTIRAGGRDSADLQHNWDYIKIKQTPRGKNKGSLLDKCPTITANAFEQNNHVIVGDFRSDEGFRPRKDGNCPTINARARTDGNGQPIIAIPVLTPDRPEKRQNGRRFKENGEPSFTLTAQDKHGVMLDTAYAMGSAKKGRSCIGASRIPEIGNEEHSVRRLTEIECERLQGCPDNWTLKGICIPPHLFKYIYKKKMHKSPELKQRMYLRMVIKTQNNRKREITIPATQRYKMCGNSVSRPVVKRVGEKIKEATNE